MQIHERIYIVGSGSAGIGISNEMDCTVYLVDGGEECALIDTGAGIETERIIKNIKKDGIDPHKVSSIFLTHGHGDHSGGAAELSEFCEATVYALKETAEYVTYGNLKALSIKDAIEAGVYGRDYKYRCCPTEVISEDEEIRIGDSILYVYRMDGHCSGHGCYGMEYQGKRILFSGDTIFNYGRISIQSIWDCDLQKYIETCKALNKIHPDILLPAHGAFLLEYGYSYIEKAMKEINSLGIPKNIIEE